MGMASARGCVLGESRPRVRPGGLTFARMRLAWWKWLAIGLMFYVLFAGMLIPLKPGLQAVDPQALDLGERVTLRLSGYNTAFAAERPPAVWLRVPVEDDVDPSGAVVTAATGVRVGGPQWLEADFVLPDVFPAGLREPFASVLVDDPGTGAFVMPASVALRAPSGVEPASGRGAWSPSPTDFTAATGVTFPYRALLGETIRNQYFHVSLWFALMFLMAGGAVAAARYLVQGDPEQDRRSEALTRVGLLFGLLGLATGMVWANFTWGRPWSGDVKQNMTAIALLIYLAYFVLRASLASPEAARRAGAAYNVFAFAMLVPLLYVIPRMRESLHPGAGGNPGFGGEDLDSTMRLVFYPGVIGFALVGLWAAQLWWRQARLAARLEDR